MKKNVLNFSRKILFSFSHSIFFILQQFWEVLNEVQITRTGLLHWFLLGKNLILENYLELILNKFII